jgi:peptidoglycan-N-acetylglucosamine deacetylase
MIPVVTPEFLKFLFPQYIWEIGVNTKTIFLTFDDGPEPEVTLRVLALLASYNAKATFFQTGFKALKYPEISKMILENGHAIGNHGFNHLSGFTTSNNDYLKNCRSGAKITKSKLYRPPYGRITPKQAKNISLFQKIIMWGIASKDYSQYQTPAKCAQNVIKNVYPGAIVLFHDTAQAENNLLNSLPKILETLQILGYDFQVLS